MLSCLPLDLWRRAEVIFEAALAHPPRQRPGFLNRVCGANETLRVTVESLLLRDDADSLFLEEPLMEPRRERTQANTQEQWLGRRLGPFQLLRPIGRGGMSDVFLGERVDGEVEQQVAVKVVRGDALRGNVLHSLRQEWQILTKLDHPNIPRSLDGGTTEEGIPYLVLEYLEGIPLTEYCDTARLNVDQRLELFRRICQVVDYAHRRLVVHCDLKPSNILVTSAGEPRLLDFGIAKLLDVVSDDSTSEEMPPTLERFFTPSYASPEQIAGEPVSTTSDIYSLGIVLYQLLTGVRPCDLDSYPSRTSTAGTPANCWFHPSQASMKSNSSGSSCTFDSPSSRSKVRGTTPSGLLQQLRGDLDSIIALCLRRSPEDRYRSAAELEQDLGRYLSGYPVLARAPNLSYRLKKFASRHRIAVSFCTAAIFVVVGLGLELILQSRQAAQERDRAELARAEAELARTEAEQQAQLLRDALSRAAPFQDPNVLSNLGLMCMDQGEHAKAEAISQRLSISQLTHHFQNY